MFIIIPLISTVLILFTLTQQVEAASSCRGLTTVPDPIEISSDNATFNIDVGNNSEPDVDRWRVEFQCGGRYQQTDATKNLDLKTISATIQRSRIPGQGCEFSEDNNPHTIMVKAVTNAGEIDWCKTSYNVDKPGNRCSLSMDPSIDPTNISITTPITINGTGLTKDGKFSVFVDDNVLDFNLATPGFVNTPAFDKKIPQNLISPGSHIVSLHRYKHPDNLTNPLDIKTWFGPSLCTVNFCVGTTDKPCQLLPPGSTPTVCSDPDKCTAGGGKQCTSDSENPGIQTAIGCIHTNPAALIKDLLTFVIGIGGGLAFLMMLLGAFQMVTSAGNPETLAAGKDRLTSAVIGLLFVIFAILLLQIIGVGILDIPGFKNP